MNPSEWQARYCGRDAATVLQNLDGAKDVYWGHDIGPEGIGVSGSMLSVHWTPTTEDLTTQYLKDTARPLTYTADESKEIIDRARELIRFGSENMDAHLKANQLHAMMKGTKAILYKKYVGHKSKQVEASPDSGNVLHDVYKGKRG